jgi:GntR family transcriptional regulator
MDPVKNLQGGLSQTAQPLYLVVYGALREALQEGRWGIGTSLPSEASLSGHFGASRITIRHALRLLESDGYIRKSRARRPVVVANSPTIHAAWIVESMDDIVAMVGDARLEIRSWRRERSSPDAEILGLRAATPLPCLRGILSRGQDAYARSIIYFPPTIGSRLRRRDFDDVVVFRVLQRELGVRIDDVRMTVWAELATPEDAAGLGCEAGSALLVTQLLYRDDTGELVEIAYSRALASEARLSTRLVTSSRLS